MKFTIEVGDARGLDPKIVAAEIRGAIDRIDTRRIGFTVTPAAESFTAVVSVYCEATLDISAHTAADAYTIAQAYLGVLETSLDMAREAELSDFGGTADLTSGDDWSCEVKRQDTSNPQTHVHGVRPS